jgi:5-methyltetrahydropteroyltriglutamate--homocysteine methyltransferase
MPPGGRTGFGGAAVVTRIRSLQAFAPGIYPRSEALVQATRDLDRGRVTQEAVDEQFHRDLEELVSVQHQAGLDLVADGMLRWQDLFRPLLESSDGFELGPLTRFLDTNTFYRAPHPTSAEPTLTVPLDEQYVAPLPGPRLVTLPSPYALALGTGLIPDVIAEGVLKPAIQGLGDVDLIVLSEPFLARDEMQELSPLANALEACRCGPKLALQLTFGDARRLLDAGLADLPVDAIGIDFYATHVTDVPKGFGKTLLAGVVDARSSVVEDASELARFADQLRTEREVEDIALVPNGDLHFVAEPIARRKLEQLGRAKTATTEVAA